jgi:hypothetical protein
MSPFAAVTAGRLILGSAVPLLVGAYLVFVAAYCYHKGEVGGLKSPGIARRAESPVAFLCGVGIYALVGVALIAIGVCGWFRVAF